MARLDQGKETAPNAFVHRTHAAPRVGALRVGTSGYHYDHWSGSFYPADLAKKDWFAHYGRHFDTVEINNTFYRLPPAHVFDAWRDAAPRGFCYAVKFSRYGTHLKRLLEPAQPIRLFLERAERLGAALGPILVQLPPHWHADFERLENFLKRLPSAHRWVVEFRDPSWLAERAFELLMRYNVALCIHDMLRDHPRRITADFTYLRFHGRRYGGSYSPQALSVQARQIRAFLKRGLDVHVYFNNDQHGYAVENGLALKRYLRAQPEPVSAAL